MKTTNNVQKAILRSGAVVISFVLISFTVSAQEFWKKLLTNSSFNEIALAMVETSNEIETTEPTENFNFILLESNFNCVGCATKFFNFVHQAQNLSFKLISHCFHYVRSRKWVNRCSDIGFISQNLLSSQCQARSFFRRQGNCFVK